MNMTWIGHNPIWKELPIRISKTLMCMTSYQYIQSKETSDTFAFPFDFHSKCWESAYNPTKETNLAINLNYVDYGDGELQN